jgi:hypothetical protein
MAVAKAILSPSPEPRFSCDAIRCFRCRTPLHYAVRPSVRCGCRQHSQPSAQLHLWASCRLLFGLAPPSWRELTNLLRSKNHQNVYRHDLLGDFVERFDRNHLVKVVTLLFPYLNCCIEILLTCGGKLSLDDGFHRFNYATRSASKASRRLFASISEGHACQVDL